MNNKVVIVGGILILLIGAVLTAVFVLQNGTVNDSTDNAVNANTINIRNMQFVNGSITVKKGTTVTWVNNDSDMHDITSNDNLFKSDTLFRGNTFAFTFNQIGEFDYYCSFHPEMIGKVTVIE